MDKFKIITSSGVEKEVDGIFYLFNSKYFFAYTEMELDENGYVMFHLVQVGKEIKNTTEGPIDTGYMVGMEISNAEEWKNVQSSITKIVDDKKNDTQSEEIQYLPQNMLSTLKIISSKTFRLAKNVVEQVFKLVMPQPQGSLIENSNNNLEMNVTLETQPESAQLAMPSSSSQTDLSNGILNIDQNSQIISPLEIHNEIDSDSNLQSGAENIENGILNVENLNNSLEPVNNINNTQANSGLEGQNDVIIDYRARFFEEQEKNQQLEEQIRILTEKLESIKTLVG